MADVDYFLGVDGGATRCRVRIRDADGNQVGEAEGGNANVFQDFASGIAVIRETAERAASGLGAGALARTAAGLGLAGVVSIESANRVAEAGLPFARTVVESDAYVACLGAHGGEDGGIVITGTGSAAFAIVGGKGHAIGGWGFALGDDGSGAQIGRSLLRRAALAVDGIIPSSPMLDRLVAEFPDSRNSMTEFVRNALPKDYATFAPRVFEAAGYGDPHGLEIVRQEADGVRLMLERLAAFGATRLSLVGGLARLFPKYLSGGIGARLVPPRADAVDGAILMAKQATL